MIKTAAQRMDTLQQLRQASTLKYRNVGMQKEAGIPILGALARGAAMAVPWVAKKAWGLGKRVAPKATGAISRTAKKAWSPIGNFLSRSGMGVAEKSTKLREGLNAARKARFKSMRTKSGVTAKNKGALRDKGALDGAKADYQKFRKNLNPLGRYFLRKSRDSQGAALRAKRSAQIMTSPAKKGGTPRGFEYKGARVGQTKGGDFAAEAFGKRVKLDRAAVEGGPAAIMGALASRGAKKRGVGKFVKDQVPGLALTGGLMHVMSPAEKASKAAKAAGGAGKAGPFGRAPKKSKSFRSMYEGL